MKQGRLKEEVQPKREAVLKAVGSSRASEGDHGAAKGSGRRCRHGCA